MNSDNNRRIAKNTLMLYIRMLILLVVRLYTSRIVLNALGVEDYGIYNIVGGVIILFSFFNNAMSNATMRFLAFDLGQKNPFQLKRTFSMSVNVHIGIALLILLLAETVGLWFLNTQLNIPIERMKAANWVYQFSILTFLINILRVPYHSSIIAHERMSFYAYLSIIEGLLKLAVVFLLQNSGFDKLIFYGFLILIVAIIVLVAYIMYSLKNFESAYYMLFWDKKLFYRLISFSGWTLFGSFANVGSRQGINILLNIFFGVTVNAAMGIANQVNNAINGFVQNFQTAFRPQIVKSYAAKDEHYLNNLILQTSRYSFFLLYIISLPLLLNTEVILQLWLKIVPQYAVSFVRLILIFSLIESVSGPLWMTVQATGKIKKYQIIISIIILSNLLISYIFLKTGHTPNIVLLVRIAISIVCLFYRLNFLKQNIGLNSTHFLLEVLFRIILVVSVSYIILLLVYKYIYTKPYSLMFPILISFLITLVSVYFLGLKREERKIINNKITTTWKKLR